MGTSQKSVCVLFLLM